MNFKTSLTAVAASLIALLGASAHAQSVSLDYLGQQIVANSATYQGTQIGGLSGIDYNAATGQFVAISDDRSALSPARFYTLGMDLAQFTRSNSAGSAGVQFSGVTTLLAPNGSAYPNNGVDPESIRLVHGAGGTTVLWGNEGLRSGAQSSYQVPTVRESTLSGGYVRDLAVPGYYAPTGSAGGTSVGDMGIRNNLAFESLTISTDGKSAYVATENALVQDGPRTSLTQSSPSRVAQYSLATGALTAEYVYNVDPIAFAPAGDRGLVEMLAVGENRFLAVERSFSTGFNIYVYLVDATNATNVAGMSSLAGQSYTAMSKTLLLDMSTVKNDDGSALFTDNIEGVTLGPVVNGKQTLIFVSDNNFNSSEITQFVAFTVNGDLAAAVPEPQTWALWLGGLAAMGAIARRRRG